MVQELEHLLGSMARAVTSQDVDGYMALISHADPEFRNEQLYFARDFAKPGKATAECAITLDATTLDIGDGSAFGEVTFTWTQAPPNPPAADPTAPADPPTPDVKPEAKQEGEPKPPAERTVTFAARFDQDRKSVV